MPSDVATPPVTLFIPQHANDTIPDDGALKSVVVVPTDKHARGVAFPPTGAALYQEFEDTMTDTITTTPGERAAQLTDTLNDGFEFVDDAVVDAQSADGPTKIGIRGSAFDAIDRFDHPVVSFIATGLAVG